MNNCDQESTTVTSTTATVVINGQQPTTKRWQARCLNHTLLGHQLLRLRRCHGKRRRNTSVEMEYDQLASIYDDRWKTYTTASLIGHWDHTKHVLQEWLTSRQHEKRRQETVIIVQTTGGDEGKYGKCASTSTSVRFDDDDDDDDHNQNNAKNNVVRMVDLGCGTGALTFFMAEQYPEWHIIGLEPSTNMITLALQHQREDRATSKMNCASTTTIDFIQGSCCETLPFFDKSIDCISTLSSYHFWDCPKVALNEIYRVLKPNGLLIITDWCGDFMACQLCGISMKFNCCQRYPPQDYHMYKLQTLAKQLQEANFMIVESSKYHINARIAKIGPKWGMMSFVAVKKEISSQE